MRVVVDARKLADSWRINPCNGNPCHAYCTALIHARVCPPPGRRTPPAPTLADDTQAPYARAQASHTPQSPPGPAGSEHRGASTTVAAGSEHRGCWAVVGAGMKQMSDTLNASLSASSSLLSASVAASAVPPPLQVDIGLGFWFGGLGVWGFRIRDIGQE